MEMIDLPTDTSDLFNTEVFGLQLVYLEHLVVATLFLFLLLSIARGKSIFDRS